MKKKYDLVVAVGKWTGRDGTEKTNWKNIGAVMVKDDGGEFILLDRTFNPAGVPNPDGRDTVLVNKFEPKQKAAGEENHKGFTKQGDQAATPTNTVLDDQTIPF